MKKLTKTYISFMVVVMIFAILIGFNMEYKEEQVYVEYTTEDKNVTCLSQIKYYIPLNYTGNIDLSINVNDLCYDVIEDRDNIRGEVNKIFEEHPEDWQDYIKSTKYDPIIIFIEDSNLTEPRRIDIFNGTIGKYTQMNE